MKKKGGLTMYLKDKEKRVTVRLSEAQYSYLKESADTLEMKPSEFLRLVVNTVMATNKVMGKVVAGAMKGIKKK